MLAILSPAKTLDLSPAEVPDVSLPEYASKAVSLNRVLKKYSVEKLQSFMSISETLAQENRIRFKQFKREHNAQNAKAAILTFSGDVYRGLSASDFDEEDLSFAQDHLRILSGMYGILRPLDLIQPYRLEMGRPLETTKGKNLYEFWDKQLTRSLNRLIAEKGHEALINLASVEYAKAVHLEKVRIPVINISFKEFRNGELKFLSYNAKRARGLMARYMIKERLKDTESLKGFNLEDYSFSEEGSTENHFLFVR